MIGGEWNGFIKAMIAEETAAIEKSRTEAKENLVKQLGGEEKYTLATALADRLWKASTNQDFTTFLKENGMIKNPYPIIRVIVDLAKKTGEDLSPAGTPKPTPKGEKGMMYDKSPAPPAR